MNTSEHGTVRELSAIEIEQVGGGRPFDPRGGLLWNLGVFTWDLGKKVITTVGPLLW